MRPSPDRCSGWRVGGQVGVEASRRFGVRTLSAVDLVCWRRRGMRRSSARHRDNQPPTLPLRIDHLRGGAQRPRQDASRPPQVLRTEPCSSLLPTHRPRPNRSKHSQSRPRSQLDKHGIAHRPAGSNTHRHPKGIDADTVSDRRLCNLPRRTLPTVPGECLGDFAPRQEVGRVFEARERDDRGVGARSRWP